MARQAWLKLLIWISICQNGVLASEQNRVKRAIMDNPPRIELNENDRGDHGDPFPLPLEEVKSLKEALPNIDRAPDEKSNNNNNDQINLDDNGGDFDSNKFAPVVDLNEGENNAENGVDPIVPDSKYSLDEGPSRNKVFPCDDYTLPRRYYGQRGVFWVLYNYFPGTKSFLCDESITYTTHSDWTYLDNLTPLLQRWQGPISIALYAPGTDFNETIKRIQYLRECTGTSGIKELVSFHIVVHNRHLPQIPPEPETLPVDCNALKGSITFGERLPTYKRSNKLLYPVNVARNVAREMSQTHYVFPSDIELYPSPNLIPDFLAMIKRNDSVLHSPNPKVFVSSIFELASNVPRLPVNKPELLEMLKNGSAIPFHKYICTHCHRLPKADEWFKAPFEPGMRVFHVGKRHKPFHHWEPIFIGTKYDPMYDEWLSYEGRKDKMTQGYILCMLDYEFHILDNAFLVHRPGIKRKKVTAKNNPIVAKQNAVIAKLILPELQKIYGTRPECFV